MRKIFIFIITAVIVCIAWVMFSNISEPSQQEEGLVQQQGQVFLSVTNGADELVVQESEFIQGMTAFGLLENTVNNLGLALKTQNFDLGVFIKSIDVIENGQDDKYWMYYVNGEMPMTSSDKYILKDGDIVEFKFEKSSF